MLEEEEEEEGADPRRCSFAAGATQVKWNRREAHIIASAHGNRVLIWDDRVSLVSLLLSPGCDGLTRLVLHSLEPLRSPRLRDTTPRSVRSSVC